MPGSLLPTTKDEWHNIRRWFSVRIRASVSLNSPSDPLVVVDGIPMDLSVLNTIPVEDVSELKVLKDAGEYGVRGANGAIVIKTGK